MEDEKKQAETERVTIAVEESSKAPVVILACEKCYAKGYRDAINNLCWFGFAFLITYAFLNLVFPTRS